MDKVKDRLMTVLLCYNFLQKKKNKNLFLFSSIIYLTFISRFDKEPAYLVSLSAWLLLRTTAAGLISPLHIKIYPPSLWDNGYFWWAGVDSDHRSQVTTDLQSVPFGRSGTYPYMELAIGIEPTTC